MDNAKRAWMVFGTHFILCEAYLLGYLASTSDGAHTQSFGRNGGRQVTIIMYTLSISTTFIWG